MNIYFISGLGANRKAFQRIRLPEPYQVHYLDWIPQEKNESLEHYAKRLAAPIDQHHPFVLVGLSFGGIVSSMLSNYLQPVCTIIISSISCSSELPWYYKLAAVSRIDRLIPETLFRPDNPVIHRLFGARSQTEKRILAEILSRNDPAFLKWGIHVILNWKQQQKPEKLFHIHGSRDTILPAKFTKADVVIHGGTHFMIWTKAGEVSQAMMKILAAYSQE